jgi:hypothetical protein
LGNPDTACLHSDDDDWGKIRIALNNLMSDACDCSRHIVCTKNLGSGLLGKTHCAFTTEYLGMKNAPREGRAHMKKD